MRDQVLESQVKEHTAQHVKDCLSIWDKTLLKMAESSPDCEQYLVQMAGLVQRSRVYARLLGDEYSETASVAIETLLTLLLEGTIVYAEKFQLVLINTGKVLAKALSLCLSDTDPQKREWSRRQVIASVYILLEAIGDATAASAYGGPCVAFPAMHTGHDDAPLHLRGFDLYRIEMEGLRLFLMELPWQDIEKRPNGITGLLDHTVRNGHVFDVRASKALTPSAHQMPSLRLLYGSCLDPDFLELLVPVPHEHIYPVNPMFVRQYKPSWGLVTKGSGEKTITLPCSFDGPKKSVEELTLEYTRALSRMFEQAAEQLEEDKKQQDLPNMLEKTTEKMVQTKQLDRSVYLPQNFIDQLFQ